MKIYYDKDVDAVYIKLEDLIPDGVLEITEGVNLDTTSDNKIVGIEILDASKKINIKNLFTYELELGSQIV